LLLAPHRDTEVHTLDAILRQVKAEAGTMNLMKALGKRDGVEVIGGDNVERVLLTPVTHGNDIFAF
jgi:hypothetical protein